MLIWVLVCWLLFRLLLRLLVFAGFSFLGVGLNAVSVLAIFKATAYMGLWSVVSVLGSCLLLAIPIFGVLLFLFLTLVYSIGVFQSIGFGSG